MITLMLIIGVVLIVMSALLLLAVPVAGILGIAFGVILILYSRSLKKKKAAEEAERQAAAMHFRAAAAGQAKARSETRAAAGFGIEKGTAAVY